MSNTNVLFPSGSAGISNISGPIDMNNNRIEELGIPDSNDDAVPYGLLLQEVADWASNPASQVVNMSGYKISNVGTPTLNGDATTKAYVDSAIQALNVSGTLAGVVMNPFTENIDGGLFSLTNVNQFASESVSSTLLQLRNPSNTPYVMASLRDGSATNLRYTFDDGTGNIYMSNRINGPVNFTGPYQYVMTNDNRMLINNLQTGETDAIDIQINHSGSSLPNKYKKNTAVMNKHGVKTMLNTRVGNNTCVYNEFIKLVDIPESYNYNSLAFKISNTSSANFFHNTDGNYSIHNTAGFIRLPIDFNLLNGNWTIHFRFRQTLQNDGTYRTFFALSDGGRTSGNYTTNRHISILRTENASAPSCPNLNFYANLDTMAPLENDTSITNTSWGVFGDYTSQHYNNFIV